METDATYDGCSIPADVYEVGMGWDTRPEVERLLGLAREAGVEPRRVLELGCGTGRLLGAMRERCERCERCAGIELSPEVAQAARRRGAEVHVGDMSDFRLAAREASESDDDSERRAIASGSSSNGCTNDAHACERFDLIYTSANTIRHVLDEAAMRRMWACVHQHLRPGGMLIADLELGRAHISAECGRPARWTLSRGEVEVDVEWSVTSAPTEAEPLCTICWTFEARGGPRAGRWSETFRLRCDEAAEFVRRAEECGLRLAALYEVRDPYLVSRPVERASGRCLVVLRWA